MIKNVKILLIILAVLLVNFTFFHLTLKKKVKIIDGDSIHLGNIKYRLYGIDAPETKQKCKRKNKDYFCGEEASKFLKFLIKEEEGFL